METYEPIWSGLETLLMETRKYAQSLALKLSRMQQIHLDRTRIPYSQADRDAIEYYLNAFLYKFFLATLNLEQLWSLSHAKRTEVLSAIENGLDTLSTDDDELLLASFLLENFLFQSKSCLDFYMIYLCRILRTEHRGSMSIPKFYKALKRAQPSELKDQAERIREYFTSHVFAKDRMIDPIAPINWGTLVTDLRDKIAHRDTLHPSFESDERLLEKVLFDWPTLRGLTFDRFCQAVQNGFFFMLTELSPLLYGLEWKAGPYKDDLW